MSNSSRLLSYLEKGLILFEVILLAIFISWHFRLGLSRHFDLDEYAYLHWGYSLSIGERPYTDFSFLIPPFFLYPLALIHKIFGRGIETIIATRVFIFLIFLATTFAIFLIAKKMRNLQVALLTACFFAFLPMPYDKMIEVRPDLFALLFSLLGVYFFFLYQDQRNKKYIFLSGFFLTASLGFIPKTVFFPPLLLGILLYKGYRSFSQSTIFRSFINELLVFILGGLVPVISLLFLFVSYNKPLFAIYSITKLPSDVTRILAIQFPIPADFFLRQNDFYYGIGGYSSPYILNLIMYLIAILWGIVRFVSSSLHPDRDKFIREVVIGALFFINLAAYVNLYPLKHSQYLILIAPFVAFYAADFVEVLFNHSYSLLDGKIAGKKSAFRVFKIVPFVVFVLLLLYIAYGAESMNERKIAWTNKESLENISYLLKTVPASAPVFDLTGGSVFFPNGYYYCCLPYGQYAEGLPKIPDLELELKKRGTKYVYIQWPDRLNSIPRKQIDYIKNNFENYLPDGSLLIKK